MYLFMFSGLTRALYLCSILLNLVIYKQFKLSGSEKKKIYWFFTVVVFAMLLNGTTKDGVDDNKINPNTCGLLLMLLFSMSIVRYHKTKGLVNLVIALLSFGLQFVYQSRTAMLGCICFILLLFMFCRRKQYCLSKSAGYVMLFFSLIGLLAAYWYSGYLFEKIGRGNVTIFGKDLFTGRQYIWNLAFESVKDHLWFGVGSDFNTDLAVAQNNNALVNVHNQSLGILTSFGIIAFVIFILVFSYLVSQSCVANDKRKKKLSYRVPIVFFVSLLIMNFSETNFFYSWSVVIMAAYSFICNSCRRPSTRREIARKPSNQRCEWIKSAE
ncbi:MAG: O-antigen ligase family protein [Clostridiales bacterium]|nr:O-antigen ligase family protein [Clostridiales bacterium]